MNNGFEESLVLFGGIRNTPFLLECLGSAFLVQMLKAIRGSRAQSSDKEEKPESEVQDESDELQDSIEEQFNSNPAQQGGFGRLLRDAMHPPAGPDPGANTFATLKRGEDTSNYIRLNMTGMIPTKEWRENPVEVGARGGADIHGRKIPGGRFMTDEAILGFLYRKPFYPPTSRLNINPFKWNKTWYPDLVPKQWNPTLNRTQYLKIDPSGQANNAADEIKPFNPRHERKGQYMRIIGDTVHYTRSAPIMSASSCAAIRLPIGVLLLLLLLLLFAPAAGLSPSLIQFCDRISAAGFAVVMPDLTHNSTDIPFPVEDPARFHDHIKKMPWAEIKPDLNFAWSFLKAARFCNEYTTGYDDDGEEIVVVGIGWGAGVAARIAADNPTFKALLLSGWASTDVTGCSFVPLQCGAGLVHPSDIKPGLLDDIKMPVLRISGKAVQGDDKRQSEENDDAAAMIKKLRSLKSSTEEIFSWITDDFISGNAEYDGEGGQDFAAAAGEASELVVNFLKTHTVEPPREFHVVKIGKPPKVVGSSVSSEDLWLLFMAFNSRRCCDSQEEKIEEIINATDPSDITERFQYVGLR
eukprot:jgi/Bigna1/70963/fgenesh1_pg.14_\